MTEQKKVLVKEKLAPEGVKYLEDLGFQVDIGTEWDADEMLKRIPEYHGLIIRSATKVTADVIQAGENLQVVGRAGVGVDNVDVKEATKRGVIVVNAPQSNVLSAAEQTIALLMACARNLAAGPRRPQGRRVDQGQVGQGRRRGARQDAGHHRPRPHRVPRRRGRPRPRHERARLRPVRPGREVPRARARARRQPGQDLPRGGLHHRSTCPRTPRRSASSATTSSPR